MIQQWAIKTEKLSKDYPGLQAVIDLDLGVLKGSVHGFLGPNGAGKSTTLRMVCGLLRPSRGRVLVNGIDPVVDPMAVKRQVGLLPESTPLYREMTVTAFLEFVARLHLLSPQEINPAIKRVIEQTGLGDVQHRLVGNLSKGYRQRVGIAQALVHDPQVIILDEPTAGLDPQSVVEIRSLIRALKGDKTVVFSSHILTEVEEVCDTISIIDRGVLKASGTLRDIKQAFQGKAQIKLQVDRPLSPPQLLALEAWGAVESSADLLWLRPTQTEDVRSQVVRYLTEQGVGVLAVELISPPLEQIFINLTERSGQ